MLGTFRIERVSQFQRVNVLLQESSSSESGDSDRALSDLLPRWRPIIGADTSARDGDQRLPAPQQELRRRAF